MINYNYLGSKQYDLRFEVAIYGDTLSFQKKYYSSATNNDSLYVDRYDLLVKKSNDTTLVVQPISKLSKTFFKKKRLLRFKKQETSIDTSIIFEKIIFHTSPCFGFCPVFSLEIDKNKQTKLYSHAIYIPEKMNRVKPKFGYFKGKINDTMYHQLIKYLQTCNLKKLEFNNQLCCDGSVITIIIYYNGKRKYLKSMFPPMIVDNLISHLYTICFNNDLSKTEKFEIEQ